MNQSGEITILGAGVCGLYAALTALRKGAKVNLIEKNDHPGGLAAGFKRGGNHFDQGVHMLHAADQEIYDDVARLMAEERLPVTLDARICWNNRSYRYPLKGLDILAGMKPLQLIRCTTGLVMAEVKNRMSQTQASAITAEDALIATYGAPLYRFFFKDFTHKYWNIHPRDLSAEFVRSKMPRLNILDLVRKGLPGFLQRRSKDLLVDSVVADETLHYSATGSETLPRVLAREVVRLGGTIHYGSGISGISETHIHLENQSLPYQKIISTIPVSALVGYLQDAPADVKDAAKNLHFKAIATYGLLVRKERCLEGLYTYYRNRIFHRVGEPKNAGLRISPGNHTVLIVEMTCDEADAKWNDDPEVREMVIADLVDESICGPEEIVEWHHFTNRHGYPIYRLHFEKNLKVVEEWLNGRKHLVSTGRQGAFKFPGMHQAMRMGQVAADSLVP